MKMAEQQKENKIGYCKLSNTTTSFLYDCFEGNVRLQLAVSIPLQYVFRHLSKLVYIFVYIRKNCIFIQTLCK